MSGKIEAEIAQLAAEERKAFLADLGLTVPGLERVIVAAYDLLNQASFFTAGEDEVRAWTITRGWKAPQAAGVIHTDFEKGFIKAEVYSFADIDRYEKESALREKGPDPLRGQGLRGQGRRCLLLQVLPALQVSL